jgi:hypothetical protein
MKQLSTLLLALSLMGCAKPVTNHGPDVSSYVTVTTEYEQIENWCSPSNCSWEITAFWEATNESEETVAVNIACDFFFFNRRLANQSNDFQQVVLGPREIISGEKTRTFLTSETSTLTAECKSQSP